MVYDVIIIGKGPAGLSASLYTTRGNLSTLILGKESGLTKAKIIENYCFLPKASGEEMINIALDQAMGFGAVIKDEEVTGIKEYEGNYIVSTDINSYQGKSIILATGKSKVKAPLKNVDHYEGKGVHYCVACDGFFYRDARVGVLGYSDYAVHELKELEEITSDRVLYTNGNTLNINEESHAYLKEKNILVKTNKILSIDGDNYLNSLLFEDGTMEKIDGLFIAYGTASSVDFARSLGVNVENNDIIVNREQETDISGVFAAGDCTGGLAQVSTAVGEGAIAGQNVKKYLRNKQ